jgi:membrane protease YdiL (CAAX protease family)
MTHVATPASIRSVPAERRHGTPLELGVVFGLTVVFGLVLSVLKGHFFSFDFGQVRLLRTLTAEAIFIVVLWPWLAWRGWSFHAIAGAPQPVDVWHGVLLYGVAYLTWYFSAYTWAVFVPGSYEAMQAAIPVGTAAAWVVVLGSIVNPVFEEFLWLAYGLTALRRYGTRVAIVASILLRMSMHLYQGQVAFISILPLAVVFTIFYVRTNRLWPVIVAHMLVDTIGLMAVVRS